MSGSEGCAYDQICNKRQRTCQTISQQNHVNAQQILENKADCRPNLPFCLPMCYVICKILYI